MMRPALMFAWPSFATSLIYRMLSMKRSHPRMVIRASNMRMSASAFLTEGIGCQNVGIVGSIFVTHVVVSDDLPSVR